MTEQTFYLWRKRLRKPEPMQFALVETATAQSAAPKAGLELVLVTARQLSRVALRMGWSMAVVPY